MTLTLCLPHRPKRQFGNWKLTFQDLPQEIILLIYQFALVEPPRWDKRHAITCHISPLRAHMMEPPPFALTKVNVANCGTKFQTTTQCNCAKRKGLSLLLASKTIHEHAAPIFWSRNKFCFMDAFECTIALGHCLRPQYRDMIRSLSIINSDSRGIPLYHVQATQDRTSTKFRNMFWNILKRCPSLRQLELAPALIRPCLGITPTNSNTVAVDEHLHSLANKLPHLSTVRLAFLLPVQRHELVWYYPRPFPSESHQVLYVKCTRFLPLRQRHNDDPWTPEALQNVFQDFYYNFCIYVATAFKVAFLGADIEKLEDYKRTWRIPPSLTPYSNVRRLSLPTGETTVVKVYALPSTAKERRHKVQLTKAEEYRKMELRQNGLRAAEYEAMKIVQERNRKFRQGEMSMERRQHEEIVLARGLRRTELKMMEAKQARNFEREKKQQVHNATKSADENRRIERKRVGSVAHV